jgi:hypothetical protein
MQPQIDPSFALSDKVLFLRVGTEITLSRTFNSQVHVPTSMMDAINQSHPTTLVNLFDLVEIKDDITYRPFA